MNHLLISCSSAISPETSSKQRNNDKIWETIQIAKTFKCRQLCLGSSKIQTTCRRSRMFRCRNLNIQIIKNTIGKIRTEHLSLQSIMIEKSVISYRSSQHGSWNNVGLTDLGFVLARVFPRFPDVRVCLVDVVVVVDVCVSDHLILTCCYILQQPLSEFEWMNEWMNAWLNEWMNVVVGVVVVVAWSRFWNIGGGNERSIFSEAMVDELENSRVNYSR